MSTNMVVILLELTFLRGREREGEKEKEKEEGEKGYHTLVVLSFRVTLFCTCTGSHTL